MKKQSTTVIRLIDILWCGLAVSLFIAEIQPLATGCARPQLVLTTLKVTLPVLPEFYCDVCAMRELVTIIAS